MSTVIETWHAILAERDFAGLNTLLAEDVVFYSPVVHTPQRGKLITFMYLSAAFSVLFNDTFKYVRQIIGANDAVLEFQVEIDSIIINGVDLIKWNDDGQIIEFKVMVRPLKAINLLHQKIGEALNRG